MCLLKFLADVRKKNEFIFSRDQKLFFESSQCSRCTLKVDKKASGKPQRGFLLNSLCLVIQRKYFVIQKHLDIMYHSLNLLFIFQFWYFCIFLLFSVLSVFSVLIDLLFTHFWLFKYIMNSVNKLQVIDFSIYVIFLIIIMFSSLNLSNYFSYSFS